MSISAGSWRAEEAAGVFRSIFSFQKPSSPARFSHFKTKVSFKHDGEVGGCVRASVARISRNTMFKKILICTRLLNKYLRSLFKYLCPVCLPLLVLSLPDLGYHTFTLCAARVFVISISGGHRARRASLMLGLKRWRGRHAGQPLDNPPRFSPNWRASGAFGALEGSSDLLAYSDRVTGTVAGQPPIPWEAGPGPRLHQHGKPTLHLTPRGHLTELPTPPLKQVRWSLTRLQESTGGSVWENNTAQDWQA